MHKNKIDEIKSKRVCHISTVHYLYDTRIFYKECCSLKKNGYEVLLVITNHKDEVIDDIKIHSLPNFNNRFSRIILGSFFALIKALWAKANIYHFHDPELIPLGLILKLINKRVIYDVHEDVSLQILNKKWIRNKYFKIVISYIFKYFEKLSCCFFDAIIVATPDIGKNYKKNNTILLRNYPINKNISPVISRKNNNTAKIIYIGSLSEERGIKEIIKAITNLEKVAELWLIGTWEDTAYQQFCMHDLKNSNIKYFGFVKPENIGSYLNSADIGLSVLYPRKNYLKSLPTKAYEYMSFSIPIIMSNFPFWKKKFKECALFVDPYNPKDISEKIKNLIYNNDLRRMLGHNGRRLIENKYSWEEESKKLIRLYDKLSN